MSAGITFSEVMMGGFSFGETDPVAGARAGIASKQRLILHARVTIPRMDLFLLDPLHAGTLDGRISVEPLGRDLLAAGVFSLFVPTGTPELKQIAYRLAFDADGRSYCLAGLKEVRRGSIFRGWSDTTTLYCRLHADGAETGAVLGAGVLRLTPWAFARQLSTFRGVNSPSLIDGTRALAGFATFFGRELVDSYLIALSPRRR